MKEWREKAVQGRGGRGDEMKQNLLMSEHTTDDAKVRLPRFASIGDGLAFLARHTLTLSALT